MDLDVTSVAHTVNGFLKKILERDFAKSPKYDKQPSVYQKLFLEADLMGLLFYAHFLWILL